MQVQAEKGNCLDTVLMTLDDQHKLRPLMIQEIPTDWKAPHHGDRRVRRLVFRIQSGFDAPS